MGIKRLIRTLGVLVLIAPTIRTEAQTTPPREDAPAVDARAILNKAAVAVAAVRSVRYDYEFWGQGGAYNLPRVIGHARFERGPDRLHSRIRVYTEVGAPDHIEKKPEPRRLEVASDGVRLTGWSGNGNQYFHGLIAEGAEVMIPSLGGNGTMAPFLENPAYSRELEAGTILTVEGQAEVQGEKCDMVRAIFPDDPTQIVWYFGCEDRLPYRMDQVMANLEGDTRLILEIRNVEVGVVFDPDIFEIEQREGSTVRVVRSHLSVGAEAPEFSLEGTDGEQYTLSDFRGRPVLVAIVASSHARSRVILPVLQRLHEDPVNKPVQLLAISHSRFEQGDPIVNLKSLGITLPFLLDGEETAEAYFVRTLGTCYLIGSTGIIEHVEVPDAFHPTDPQAFQDALQKALARLVANPGDG